MLRQRRATTHLCPPSSILRSGQTKQPIERKRDENPSYRRHGSVRAAPSSCGCQRGCAVRQLRTLCLLPPAAPGLWLLGYFHGSTDRLPVCLSVCRLHGRGTDRHTDVRDWVGRARRSAPSPAGTRRSGEGRSSVTPKFIKKSSKLTRFA